MDIKRVTVSSSLGTPPAPPENKSFTSQQTGGVATAQTNVAVGQPGKAVLLEELQSALDNINKSLQATTEGLEFKVDADSSRTIVQVVDRATKEILRQIPSEEALQIAKSLTLRTKGLFIRQQA